MLPFAKQIRFASPSRFVQIAVSVVCLSSVAGCVTSTSSVNTSSTNSEISATPVSSAVTYQTTSKEYRVLSEFVYKQAEAALPLQFTKNEVIVMDVDETVLDNSQYQKERESVGLGYTSKSWESWVKRKEASLVPGVNSFLNAVLAREGKVVLITNRDKQLDRYTWENLLALGLPLTPANTCIVGREKADKMALGQTGIINDKDRRRALLREGKINCSIDEQSETWREQHTIIMQIGDNVEDFSGITQESADLSQLRQKVGSEYFLLPNPMYGSW
ncbi:hypothetical protein D210916BOD24_30020 [Alteromonas sp. D210916BOD_24]|uniref:5'-nucleotidase, lipoprotein e(P4) family n=1 Tax=Alteromonas sp. D210916BOD_24 TaxID=3157618 RepID=UPI00399C790F